MRFAYYDADLRHVRRYIFIPMRHIHSEIEKKVTISSWHKQELKNNRDYLQVSMYENREQREREREGSASPGEFAIERMPECELARQLKAISAVIIS